MLNSLINKTIKSSRTHQARIGLSLNPFLLLLVLSVQASISAHAESAFSWTPPLLCDYYPDHHMILCVSNKQGLKISAARLNNGDCKIPKSATSPATSSSDDKIFYNSNNFPTGGDFRKTYQDGDKFIIPVDLKCDLKTYSVSADDKEWTFDYRPLLPFLDRN